MLATLLPTLHKIFLPTLLKSSVIGEKISAVRKIMPHEGGGKPQNIGKKYMKKCQ
jgi:hypothetical protein